MEIPTSAAGSATELVLQLFGIVAIAATSERQF
jgi:hypothetical protein